MFNALQNVKILKNIFSKIFESSLIGFKFCFLRPIVGRKFTHMHCGAGFFTRATKKTLTFWLVFT